MAFSVRPVRPNTWTRLASVHCWLTCGRSPGNLTFLLAVHRQARRANQHCTQITPWMMAGWHLPAPLCFAPAAFSVVSQLGTMVSRQVTGTTWIQSQHYRRTQARTANSGPRRDQCSARAAPVLLIRRTRPHLVQVPQQFGPWQGRTIRLLQCRRRAVLTAPKCTRCRALENCQTKAFWAHVYPFCKASIEMAYPPLVLSQTNLPHYHRQAVQQQKLCDSLSSVGCTSRSWMRALKNHLLSVHTTVR